MKNIFLVLLLIVSFLGFSQDIKLKKGEVLVDDKAWLNYDGCGGFSQSCSLMMTSNKEEVIYMNLVIVPGVEPITNYNKTGDLKYIEVKFLGLNKIIELDLTFKKAISIIYNSKCVNADGTFDEEKVERLVEKYGTPFSDRLNKTTNNTNTIIIKEEPRRSGVNINIGR
ncbi:hypothetical protein SAMN05660845_1116 [Flavobacterium swingsii]|jgi:hypothetical protein|uniref:Uncharacterized protein n=1 Tax=Flavobacterium swingsii TaxID=498292 RepID=A0A1I0X9N5_9FLAO|nr:hypothetical protein [Flavobacterium swingsii]SFA97752.1 hypothetical protein SAMN05660845_1116 [Flavobacterium swingsii]